MMEVLDLAKLLKTESLFSQCDVNDIDLYYDKQQIEKLIPHRKPFLFIDQIEKININNLKIQGKFHLSSEDPIFNGHFPGEPLFPGVLQVEMMGQLALCLVALLRSNLNSNAFLQQPVRAVATRVKDAAFYDSLPPDQTVIIQALIHYQDDFVGILAGQILNKFGGICSSAIVEVFYVES